MARVILHLSYDLGDDFEDDAPTAPEVWREYLQGEPIEPGNVGIERVRIEPTFHVENLDEWSSPLEARVTLREIENGGLALGVDYNRDVRPGDSAGIVCRVLEPMLGLFEQTGFAEEKEREPVPRNYVILPMNYDFPTSRFEVGRTPRDRDIPASDYPEAVREAARRGEADHFARPMCVFDVADRRVMAIVWNGQLFEDGGDLHEYAVDE